ncbi:cytochrome c oxidase subunit II [Halobacillus sp. BBL2006]|uniref:cytochrome c oxidase subunit II n=1 Tax=Halobacillus sp. BBL2006 TaxID=1543706 RepID=UPI000690431E|nr:cytochrome c oxidase subunit II [Halobacillus sp. BBL2006]
MRKAGLFLMLILLSGCNIRVLDPASDTAEKLTDLIYLSFGLMMLVFIVVIILFVRFVSKYRDNSESKPRTIKDDKENKWLELTWTILPFILLAILAVPTIKATYDLTSSISENEEGSSGDEIIIDVEAQRFNWKFTYENGSTSYDELVLPVGKKVKFRLTSKDVIHSFWIPSLAGKIDVIPGKETKLSFRPSDTGTFQGKCAEFCGAEHALMRFETRVVSNFEFQQWLKQE